MLTRLLGGTSHPSGGCVWLTVLWETLSVSATLPTICEEGTAMVLTWHYQRFTLETLCIHLQIRFPACTHLKPHIENHVDAQLHLNRRTWQLHAPCTAPGAHIAQINIFFPPPVHANYLPAVAFLPMSSEEQLVFSHWPIFSQFDRATETLD